VLNIGYRMTASEHKINIIGVNQCRQQHSGMRPVSGGGIDDDDDDEPVYALLLSSAKREFL